MFQLMDGGKPLDDDFRRTAGRDGGGSIGGNMQGDQSSSSSERSHGGEHGGAGVLLGAGDDGHPASHALVEIKGAPGLGEVHGLRRDQLEIARVFSRQGVH